MKELDLTKAEDCRWYIENFELPEGKMTFVDLTGGRRVYLETMSDDDAVMIANDLYQMELEGNEKAKKQFVRDGGKLQ